MSKITQDYVRGLHDGEKVAKREARIETFGAVRRAVIYARLLDKKADATYKQGAVMAAIITRKHAQLHRDAIRAALGIEHKP